jgi:large subunit ribosomal protein L13
MKTYSITPAEIEKKWLIIDADGVVLGRMAAEIAKILRGKHKPGFTPHMDCGDNVIVVNANKVRLTGKKIDRQGLLPTYRLSGRHQIADGARNSGRQVSRKCRAQSGRTDAAERPLGTHPVGNLRVYPGPDHEHEAQQPETLDVAAMNPKNKRSV